MIANVRDVISPAIKEVFSDYVGSDERLMIWDASLIETAYRCGGDCEGTEVDEDGDAYHNDFAVVLNMVLLDQSAEPRNGSYLIPGHLIVYGNLAEAMSHLRMRLDFEAQAEGMPDLREIGESIIQEYRG